MTGTTIDPAGYVRTSASAPLRVKAEAVSESMRAYST
jgi:hypothetical protein